PARSGLRRRPKRRGVPHTPGISRLGSRRSPSPKRTDRIRQRLPNETKGKRHYGRRPGRKQAATRKGSPETCPAARRYPTRSARQVRQFNSRESCRRHLSAYQSSPSLSSPAGVMAARSVFSLTFRLTKRREPSTSITLKPSLRKPNLGRAFLAS